MGKTKPVGPSLAVWVSDSWDASPLLEAWAVGSRLRVPACTLVPCVT